MCNTVHVCFHTLLLAVITYIIMTVYEIILNPAKTIQSMNIQIFLARIHLVALVTTDCVHTTVFTKRTRWCSVYCRYWSTLSTYVKKIVRTI